MKHRFFAALASAFLAIAPCTADAATVHYELSGASTASWDIERSPVPDASNAAAFELHGISGSFPIAGPVSIAFFVTGATPVSGGFALFNSTPDDAIIAPGPQLFTGPTSAPLLRLGTFVLDRAFFFEGNLVIVPGAYTLVASSVPEPEVWALLVIGFAATGGIMRARRRHVDGPAG